MIRKYLDNYRHFMCFIAIFLPMSLFAQQEGSRILYKAQGRVVSLSFSFCHKDSVCEKHQAILGPDSFLSEEHLGYRLVASISGTYTQGYSRYLEKVYEIPDADFDALCRAEKAKGANEQIFVIEIKVNGQTKRYEIVSPKKKDVPRKLLNQFKKVQALAEAIRKTQNAYDRKAVILNNQ